MQCNIDARGRAARLLSGLIACVAAMVVLALSTAHVIPNPWGWIIGLGLLLSGAFQVFEGWAGWCVLRAMGIKTRV